MAVLVRYLVTSPATSKEFVSAIREAIDNGSRTVTFAAKDTLTNEAIASIFTLRRSHYDTSDSVLARYTGTLDDNSIATISAYTHPDMSDTPAQLTLVRQSAP